MKKLILIFSMALVLALANKFIFHPDITFIRYEIEKYEPVGEGTGPDMCPAPSVLSAPKEIGIETAKCFYDKGVAFIDARDQDIYDEGTIKGAISIPFNDFDPGYVDDYEIDLDVLYVIFCDGGDCTLGADLAEVLFDLGYEMLLLYEGGFPEWTENLYPVNRVQ
tara:strand:- start:730 stop:1224 length:495 start_codon:yes stop_codon:yes gene_type:complete